MTAYILPEGKQSFTTVTGAPLVGGRVYTYAAGTSTLKTTWSDAAQVAPNTNPVILDARGEASIFWDGNYKVVLRDAADVVIWTVDFVQDGSNGLRTDLAASSGSALVGFLQAGTGAVARTVQSKLRDVVNVKDFGAVGDGITDDTAAIQAAIYQAGLAFAGQQWFDTIEPVGDPPQGVAFTGGKTYRIAGTVYVPQGVIIDFNGATIIGTGNGAGGNILFETGYYSGGALISNWAAGDEAQRVVYTKFRNGRFMDCRVAFRLFNFNEGSFVEDCSFLDCRQNVVASRCFYGGFQRLMSRGSAGGTTLPAYQFYNSGAVTVVNNIIELDSVVAIGRFLGFSFADGCAGLSLRNCAAEFGANGFLFSGDVSALDFVGNYLEGLTGYGVFFDGTGSVNGINIDANWFLTVGLGIGGSLLRSGRIGAANRFSGCFSNITITDNLNSLITVELPPTPVSSGAPALPAGYTLGSKIKIAYPTAFLDSGGIAVVNQNFAGANPIELPYSGRSGFLAGGIPYCTSVVNNGTATVTITTGIISEPYMMGALLIAVADNLGSYLFRGQFWGSGGGAAPFNTPVITLEGTTQGSRTATPSVVGGRLVITLGGFAAPISTPEGVVRLM